MKINLFGLNNWGTKKLLRVIISIQLLMLGAIGFDFIGLGIPLLRQVIGIIYLTFIPGVLILRLLRLHNLNPLEFLLYSIGLSISFLMFSGLFINTFYPVLGFSKPLSDLSVIYSITLFISVICLLLYKYGSHDKNSILNQVREINIPKDAIYLSMLFIILLISIIGTYRINSYHDNLLLLVLIFSIILLLIYVFFDNSSLKQFYPVTVFVIALAILYSISLVSKSLTGYDIHVEYSYYKLVEGNSIWNSYIPGDSERSLNMNAMLSVTILPLIYSKFLNMEGVLLFKIIFPFIFAFSFAGLYYVYSRQIGDKKALFSVMFILSFIYFISFEMLSLARQMIAQLFFVLLLILMLNKEISQIKKYTLYAIFAFSLVVSHYGLSYIYMFTLISIFLIQYIRDIYEKGILYKSFFNKNVILLFVIFALFWYMYISNSSAFNTIVKIGDHTLTNIRTEFFSLESRERSVLSAIGLESTRTVSFGRKIHQIIQLTSQLFIVVGAFLVLTKNKFGFNRDYILLLPMNLGFIFASIVFPYFSRETMNMTRLYQTTLLVLSPLVVIGGEAIIGKLLNIKSNLTDTISTPLTLKLLVLFILIPYLAFNTGFVYEITKDEPLLTPLGMERIRVSGSNYSKAGLYDTYTPEQDIVGAAWLSNHRNIASDVISSENIQWKKNQSQEGSYIYLKYANNIDDILFYPVGLGELKVMNMSTQIREIHRVKNKIYTNGGSETYWLGREIS